MNTAFIYGLAMAIANSLVNYALYFLGFHETPEKLATAQMVGGCLALVISITCLALGCRAKRTETPAAEAFGYGRSFLTCFMISLWGVIFGTISQVLYIAVINPGFRDVVFQAQMAKAEAGGATAAQLEKAEGIMRTMTGPVAQGIFGFLFGLVICTLLSLIIAAFIRRPAADELKAA